MPVTREENNLSINEAVPVSASSMDFETFQLKSHFWGRLTVWGIIALTLIVPL